MCSTKNKPMKKKRENPTKTKEKNKENENLEETNSIEWKQRNPEK